MVINEIKKKNCTQSSQTIVSLRIQSSFDYRKFTMDWGSCVIGMGIWLVSKWGGGAGRGRGVKINFELLQSPFHH